MKRSYRFIIVFLILTIIFSSLFAVLTYAELDRVRKNSNEAVVQIIADLKEKYPDISDSRIAQILNDKADVENTVEMLKKYGIETDTDWLVNRNGELETGIIAANSFMSAFSCVALCAVFIVYCIKRKRETHKITEYIAQINKKKYDLAIDENSEDEMSALKNEIYKTTVMLKEQSENSLKDKENLKDSLSDISHQLKTPLTSIMIMLDNITDNEDMPTEVRTEFLNDIRRETNNINFLVQSILTLSKFDANSIVLKSRPEYLSKIIEECRQNTAVLAEIKEVEVITECDKSIALNCDFKWLCEAVTNIVKNCIEHTPRGGTVKIAAEQNRLYTKISISDNGSGIDQKDLPHIFERFYKGKNSDENSVGIGLALAKTIVEKGGGYLSVDSCADKGSTFVIKYF